MDKILGGGRYQITLQGGQVVTAQLSGRMRRFRIRVIPGDRVQVGTLTVLKFTYQDELEQTLQKRLYDKATRDPLVDAHNRSYFDDYVETAFAMANRQKRPLSGDDDRRRSLQARQRRGRPHGR